MIGRDSTEEERLKVFKSDIVILSITFDAYPNILQELKPHLQKGSLLVDVCSIKVKPAELIKEVFPQHKNLLITHPLFGPQSAKKSTKDLRLILCESSGALAESLLEYCRTKLKLNIIQMTAEEHDQALAYTHALTFFISESLAPFNLDEHGITTPSFAKLLSLSKVAGIESRELLDSVHRDNPYAQKVRDEFANRVDELRSKLDGLT